MCSLLRSIYSHDCCLIADIVYAFEDNNLESLLPSAETMGLDERLPFLLSYPYRAQGGHVFFVACIPQDADYHSGPGDLLLCRWLLVLIGRCP